MAQNRLRIPLVWIRVQLAFMGCLFFVTSSGISAEPTNASTTGSEDQARLVTRASGLTEPLFGTYHVSQQHQIKPGNAFYPSIANLNGTLYVIQGSHNSLFIQTLDPKTFEPGEATEVWNTQKDTGNRKLTYPPGVNDIRAFDGKLYFSTTCAWDARAEGLSKNAGLVARKQQQHSPVKHLKSRSIWKVHYRLFKNANESLNWGEMDLATNIVKPGNQRERMGSCRLVQRRSEHHRMPGYSSQICHESGFPCSSNLKLQPTPGLS